MKTLSILLFVCGALAFNPVLPLLQPNNTLASEPTTDIISDPLAKRWTCPSTCSTNICCENGLCVWSLSDVCCGSYFCNAGNHCCGTGCMPSGGDCCGVQGYCPAGERCMTVNGRLTCCPNGDCRQGNAVDYFTQRTTYTYTQNYYTTTQRTTTYTNVDWTWYSWTVTWTYWVTFYTYYAPSTASIRTSTVTTTSTVVSVHATDASDASSSFTRLSATMSFYTPATATNPPMPTDAVTDSGPTFSPISSGSNGGSGSNSGSGSVGGISGNGVMGGSAPNAANVNRRLGWEAILTLSIVLGTGFLMVYL
ncbi:hypothetical protein CFD26_106185 [Aspergillus turcosus]|uniref:GPI anchored protein n=1 Tax=Aspergillus turcosus TaxID=1245748 RepID=A0A421D2F3_9EURO|nr:hypothetical protein CFD26_106185 [Aspergillus turcosus]